MGDQKLYELLSRYRRGDITPEDMRKLDEWYESFSGEEERIRSVPREKLDQLFYAVERRTAPTRGKRKPAVIVRWAAVAAVCAVIAAVAVFELGAPWKKQSVSPFPVRETWHAELIVGDGSRVRLDAVPAIEENGTVIANNGNAGLEYSNAAGSDTENIRHTIIVPMGREYAITLSDGSRVMLNSASELTYPVSFGGDVRGVELKGEGYFEIAQSPVPFVVNANPLDVRVLGTSFNIAAYGDDDAITTTLVSGRVSVRADGGDEYLLDPGYQLCYDKGDRSVTRREADPDIATAWLYGEFKFRDMRLDEIIRRLSRWYGYDYRFDDTRLKDMRITGAAEKERPVEYVLGMLGYITDIRFSIDGGVIVIGGD